MDSNQPSFDNQIIYKLATIETQVKGIAENLTAAIQRVEDKIQESHRDQAADHAKLETKVEAAEKRISNLERYRDNLMARVGGSMAVVIFFWTMFGSAIEAKLTSIFH